MAHDRRAVGTAGGENRPAAVRARVRPGHIEVSFPYDDADVRIIRDVPGREWNREIQRWVLPRSDRSLSDLRRAFGARLVVEKEIPPPPATADVARHVEWTLELVRAEMRAREFTRKTQRAYLWWVERFLRFRKGVLPGRLGAEDARKFLDHLARDDVAAKSRNQAAAAIAFMFRAVFDKNELADIPRAKEPQRTPPVLSHREVLRVLKELDGKYQLIASLLYSAGLRLDECLGLRVKDVDLELRQILVRDGKGRKDRYVPLAERVAPRLRAQIRRVTLLHQRDRDQGHGWAPLPGALHRKNPTAGYELGWQFLFPARKPTTDPSTGNTGRSPLHASAVQRKVKQAVRRSGIPKHATCHTLRHSFATEALRGGVDIRLLQHVMGHKDVRTTMIYLHVVEQTGHFIRSPLDRPGEAEEGEGEGEEEEDMEKEEDDDDPGPTIPGPILQRAKPPAGQQKLR